jgi:hypothetical protein
MIVLIRRGDFDDAHGRRSPSASPAVCDGTTSCVAKRLGRGASCMCADSTNRPLAAGQRPANDNGLAGRLFEPSLNRRNAAKVDPANPGFPPGPNILRIDLHLGQILYKLTVLYFYTGSVMDQLIRILNDGDRETLAWLRKHVGDVRVAAAARHLGGNGKPYVSAVCRYLSVRPPTPHQHSRPVEDCTIGDNYLAQIRQLLTQRNQALAKHQV